MQSDSSNRGPDTSHAGLTRTRCIAMTLVAVSSGLFGQTQNQIVSLGYSAPFEDPAVQSVQRGQLITLFTSPLGVPDAAAAETPLPGSLSGVSVLVRVVGAMDATGYPAMLPILRVESGSVAQLPSGAWCSLAKGPMPVLCSFSMITVEIPTEPVCALTPLELNMHEDCTTVQFHNDPPMLVLNVKANGVTGPDMPIQVGRRSPTHFLNSCDLIFGVHNSGGCHPFITHADGTLVSDDSPAKVGEVITIYYISGSNAPTGYPEAAPSGSPRRGTVSFSYPVEGPVPTELPGNSTSLETVVWADWSGVVPGYIGLGQMNVTIPPRPNDNYRCSGYTYPNKPGNAQISIPGFAENALYVCIQP